MRLSSAMETRARNLICSCDHTDCKMQKELLLEIDYLRNELSTYKQVYPGVPVVPGMSVSWGHTGPCQPNCDCWLALNPRK